MLHPSTPTDINAADMAVLQEHMHPDWPDAWADFVYVFFIGLQATNAAELPVEVKAKIATQQVLALAEHIGGQQIYVPRGTHQAKSQIANAIRESFNGRNYRELASRYGISEMRVRQIVNGGRKACAKNASKPPTSASNQKFNRW